MTGLHIIFKDGVSAYVEELQILDTYAGQLAGTFTVGTRFRIPAYTDLMEELKTGKQTGYYYLPPELVDEAELRGISPEEAERIRQHTELGKCLKELHLVATLHISDEDCCHILQMHWFQSGKELAEIPLARLIQEAAGRFTFKELQPFCEHVDWLEMY